MTAAASTGPTDEEIRELARTRVGFRYHAAAYVLVNALLVGIWWYERSRSGIDEDSAGLDGGPFWPIWSILGWGMGLAFHGWAAYGRRLDAVAREEAKLRQKYGR